MGVSLCSVWAHHLTFFVFFFAWKSIVSPQKAPQAWFNRTRVCVQPESTIVWYIPSWYFTKILYVLPKPEEGVARPATWITCLTWVSGQSFVVPRLPAFPALLPQPPPSSPADSRAPTLSSSMWTAESAVRWPRALGWTSSLQMTLAKQFSTWLHKHNVVWSRYSVK